MPRKKVDSGPTIEEIVIKLESKLEGIEDKSEKRNNELEEKIECLSHKIENRLSYVEESTSRKNNDFEEKLKSLVEKVYGMDGAFQEEYEDNVEKFKDFESQVSSYKEKIETATKMIEDMQEKMYDYETNKKNNLIFYGIATEQGETKDKLLMIIRTLLKIELKLQKDVGLESVNRVLNGPEVMGCRPVLVAFSNFKERQEVFERATAKTKSTTFSVTEDMSKKTREARRELRRYLVKVKKGSPEKKCFLHYDKLYVDGRLFVFNQQEGKVVPQQLQMGNMGGSEDGRYGLHKNTRPEKASLL